MGVLENVREPRDLRRLSDDELTALAAEIRDVLVLTCSRTGGHLGPNLGTVELTIALHRVFDSPRDPILFDTGHQAYVHKLLTGRRDGFPTLRQQGGLSGYPSRSESEHDWIENSHASTALSYADGLSKGFAIRGERERTVVAVVGDGALTGGMAWEALNNIAGGPKGLPGERPARPVVIVVNDNGRSYAPTVGGVADHLAGLRTNPRYERVLDLIKRSLFQHPSRRSAAVRRAARDQEGPQRRAGPAGTVRGPRAEVHRPGRRARPGRGRAGPCSGQALPGARHRSLRDPEGLRLRARCA